MIVVVGKLCEWVSNVTGSINKGLEFIDEHQNKIESIINDYVSFSNKMEGKSTLSKLRHILIKFFTFKLLFSIIKTDGKLWG